MELSIKEQKALNKRDKILNGNLWKLVISISLPVVLYNLCNYIYTIYDMMVVQKANIGSAADIVVLDQIKNMLSTIGSALATAGGVLVARKYGENKIDDARKCANTFFTLALLIAGFILIFIPLGIPFLKLLNTDQSIIDNSIGYFNIQIIILLITTMNCTFIALEKAKGNTFHLLCLNIGVIFIKIFLTTLFAFGPFENVTVTWLAVATLLAQSFMFICGMYLCFRRSNILQIRIKELNFNKSYCKSLIVLAIPVFIDSFLFNYGKVFINSVATTVYGLTCVGALGISNTMAGLLSTIISSFKEGGSAIVSQNYGNKNGKRIISFFKVNFIYIISISALGTIILYLLKSPIAEFFSPNDQLQREMIINIFKWECLDIMFMGLSGAAMTLFYGFGKTRLTMCLGLCTLFLYRIPILLFLIYVVNMNYEACGIAMFASNFLSGSVAFIVAIIFIQYIKKNDKYKFLFEPR